jgi:hypothetical protein
MSLLRIKFHNLFQFGLSWSYNPGRGFGKLTQVDTICCHLNIFLKTDVIMNFFLVKLYFYLSSKLFLDLLS